MDLDLLLKEYIYRSTFRLENELIEIRNRIRSDRIDNVDLITYIETNTRIQTAEEIFGDLYNIMTLARPPNC